MKALRLVALTALFAVPFVPLAVVPTMIFPFVTGKALAFRILAEIAFAAFLWLAVLGRKPPFLGPMFWVFAALMAWMALADAMAVNPALAFMGNIERRGGYIELAHVFAYFTVATALLDGLWRRYLGTMTLAATAVAAVGGYQLWLYTLTGQPQAALYSTLGNPSYLGAYAAMGLFIALYMAQTGSRWWFAAVVPQIAMVMMSQSRASILAMGAGLFVFCVAAKRWKELGIAAAAIAAMAVSGNTVFSRFAEITLSGPTADPRLQIWRWALTAVRDHPFFGWGQEGFRYAFAAYGHTIEGWPFDRAHNLVLDWFIAGGLGGFMGYAMLLALTALYLRREPILLGLLAAYVVNMMFVFDTMSTYIPLAAVMAFAAATAKRPRFPEGVSRSPLAADGPDRRRNRWPF